MNKYHLLTALGCSVVPALAVLSGCGTSQTPNYVAAGAPETPLRQTSNKPANPVSEAAYLAMEKNCGSCHGEGARMNRKVPLDRASYSRLVEKKLVVPGKPQESLLYTVMLDKNDPMPPPRARQRPSSAEIAAIRLWIEKGAPSPSPK